MREATRHTAAATPAAREPLAVTAYGVLMAIRAAVRQRFGRDTLEGLSVAIQGLGNVGLPLAGYLREAGAVLCVADLDPARVGEAARRFGARAGRAGGDPPRSRSSCSRPARSARCSTTARSRELQARIVCGGANNQLAAARHDAMLAARGILYVPDYLANAGGVIDFHQERIDDAAAAVLAAVGRIEAIAGGCPAHGSALGPHAARGRRRAGARPPRERAAAQAAA